MKKIYFTTNPDGYDTEGIGAMAQYQIICYCLSKLYDTNFYFTGFKNLTHYQYFDITKDEWCNTITNFFNLPISDSLNLPIIKFSGINLDLNNFIDNNDGVIIDFEPEYLMNFIDEYVDDETIQSILNSIGKSLVLGDTIKYFDKSKKNISIHIRKYTKTDCDLNPRREYFDDNKKKFYIDFINKFSSNDVYFHIYSQGLESDFDFLKNDNVFLHIEENPLVSLYHMVNSDVLLTANSSLSYVAHLLGNHKECFVRDTFFHKWKSNSIKI